MLSPKWSIYTPLTYKAQGTLRNKEWKECKSQRNVVRRCHLEMTWSLYSWTLCSYGYLLKIKTRSVNTGADSTNWPLWVSLDPKGDDMKVGHCYTTRWCLRIMGGMSWGGYDQGTWWTCMKLFFEKIKREGKLRQFFFTLSVIGANVWRKWRSLLTRGKQSLINMLTKLSITWRNQVRCTAQWILCTFLTPIIQWVLNS